LARTFRATISISMQGKSTFGKVPIDAEVVDDLGLKPGETLRASMRGTNFTGKVFGSMKSPGLLVPIDVVRSLGLREGQGVRVTVHGRT
jgi:antitoxin component of MazEF toxin-antitoxin module